MRKRSIQPVLEHVKPEDKAKRLELAEARIVARALIG